MTFQLLARDEMGSFQLCESMPDLVAGQGKEKETNKVTTITYCTQVEVGEYHHRFRVHATSYMWGL